MQGREEQKIVTFKKLLPTNVPFVAVIVAWSYLNSYRTNFLFHFYRNSCSLDGYFCCFSPSTSLILF